MSIFKCRFRCRFRCRCYSCCLSCRMRTRRNNRKIAKTVPMFILYKKRFLCHSTLWHLSKFPFQIDGPQGLLQLFMQQNSRKKSCFSLEIEREEKEIPRCTRRVEGYEICSSLCAARARYKSFNLVLQFFDREDALIPVFGPNSLQLLTDVIFLAFVCLKKSHDNKI